MMTDIDKYLSFVLTMFIAFGVTFEMPVIVVVLVRLGIVSLEKLQAIRAYVIVGAFVIGAVVTPPDVVCAAAARDPAVPALRGGPVPRALRHAEAPRRRGAGRR